MRKLAKGFGNTESFSVRTLRTVLRLKIEDFVLRVWGFQILTVRIVRTHLGSNTFKNALHSAHLQHYAHYFISIAIVYNHTFLSYKEDQWCLYKNLSIKSAQLLPSIIPISHGDVTQICKRDISRREHKISNLKYFCHFWRAVYTITL